MAVFFAVSNLAPASGGEVRHGKRDGQGTSKVLGSPQRATVTKVEAATVAEAQELVRQLAPSGGEIVVVTEAQWKTS